MNAASSMTAPFAIMIVKLRQVQQVQTVIDQVKERAEHCPKDFALAAIQACAADHGSPDDIQEDTLPEHWRTRFESPRVKNGRDGRAQTTHHVGANNHSLRRNT